MNINILLVSRASEAKHMITFFHTDIEQVAFGTGVLVDGMDFADDKMLQARTFVCFGYPLTETLSTLSRAINEPDYNEYVRDATIQRFEYIP